MTRPFHIALLALCAGCSAPAPPAPQPATPAATEGEPVADALEMSGIKLYLYDAAATPGVEGCILTPQGPITSARFHEHVSKTV